MGANRITSAATVLAFASALALAPSAGAAVTCNYEAAGVVDVRMSQMFDSARLQVAGGNIEVRNGQDQNVACTGGTPTTTNTNTVLISDDSDDPSTPAGGDEAQRRSLARSLSNGRKPGAKVTVQAVDAAGNRVTRTLRVTAKR